MATLQDILVYGMFGNTGRDYLIALAIFLCLFIIFKAFDSFVITFFRKTAGKTRIQWDDIIVDFLGAIHWQFYAFISLYLASLTLEFPSVLKRILWSLMIIFVAFYLAMGLGRIVDYFTRKQLERRSQSKENTSMIKVFGILFKIVIWSIAFLMVLANLGIEITPLIASLGIGGIAIALALQSILGDLFSAFAIYFDKPFKEGDFIIIGNDMGTVKQIGIKTTRIDTLQGQELSISNSELTNSRINNYSRMEKRRIVFAFGVEYSTSAKKMRQINEIIRKSIESTKKTQIDRVHFKEFGNFSLNYEVVYYVLSPDYNLYMDVQEEINLKIKEAFEKEKIGFAYPTQTLYVEGVKK